MPSATKSKQARVITAKYDSKCVNCGGKITAGQSQLVRDRTRKKWVHVKCDNRSTWPPEPGPAPAPEKKTPEPGPENLVETTEQPDTGASEDIKELAATVRQMIDERAEQHNREQEERFEALARVDSRLYGELDKLRTELEIAREELAKQQQVTLTLAKPDGAHRDVPGVQHEQFLKIRNLARLRKNIMLVGPTGSGKTHTAAQVADSLELPFASISCSAGMSEGQILGRLLPVGGGGRFEFVGTDFLRCYEEGGVFLFDEFDAADDNLLLIVNSALANGYVSVPNRPEKPRAEKHEDFICIVAANTWGLGADREYCGRNQLDAATLNRFQIGMVELDYDSRVEAMLCPDRDLQKHLDDWREAIFACRLHRVVSTRFYKDAHELVATLDPDTDEAMFGYDDVRTALTSGWSEAELEQVYAAKPGLRPNA